MKLQDQRTIEVLEAQMPEHSKEHKDKSCVRQPYCTPEVVLVGKANRLVASGPIGSFVDFHQSYYSVIN